MRAATLDLRESAISCTDTPQYSAVVQHTQNIRATRPAESSTKAPCFPLANKVETAPRPPPPSTVLLVPAEEVTSPRAALRARDMVSEAPARDADAPAERAYSYAHQRRDALCQATLLGVLWRHARSLAHMKRRSRHLPAIPRPCRTCQSAPLSMLLGSALPLRGRHVCRRYPSDPGRCASQYFVARAGGT
jgi:hypothetical protein